MPDKDLLCKGISPRWGQPYTRFVEWQLDHSSIAHSHLIRLKNELQGLGNEPIYHFRDHDKHLTAARQAFMARNIDYILECEHINRSIQILGGNKRGMNFAQEASKERLNALLEDPMLDNHIYPMTRNYVEKVYVSHYEAPVRRYAEVSKEEVEYRLNVLRPLINLGMDSYAEQLVNNLDVNKLRVPRGFAARELTSDSEITDYLDQSIKLN